MQFSIFIFFQFSFDIISTSKNYHKRKPNYRAVILKRYQINQIGSLSKNLQVTKETKRTFDIRGLYSTKRLLYSALNSRAIILQNQTFVGPLFLPWARRALCKGRCSSEFSSQGHCFHLLLSFTFSKGMPLHVRDIILSI